jgi:hypothetical protein
LLIPLVGLISSVSDTRSSKTNNFEITVFLKAFSSSGRLFCYLLVP